MQYPVVGCIPQSGDATLTVMHPKAGRNRLGGPRVRAVMFASVFACALALPGTAFGGADPVKGGDTTLDLSLGKVKVKAISPATREGKTLVHLPNTGGNLDPVSGVGTLDNGGGFRLKKKGRKKVKVTTIRTTFGPNGNVSARVGKKKVPSLAVVQGGTTTRDDFGARISGAKATLTKKGAKALNKAFKKKKGKGKIKSGKPLGTLSTVTVPKTVEVLPQGSMVFEPNPSITLDKFLPKGVNPANGVAAVAPGVMHVGPSITFEFPITGGSLGLGLNDGRLVTGGGLKLTKTMPAGVLPAACEDKYPVGNFVKQTSLSPDFTQNALLANVDYQGGRLAANSGAGSLDFSNATTTVNHATKKATVDGVTVKVSQFAASLLNNQIFGPSSAGCGPASSDFKNGDVLGSISFTATLR